MDLQRKLSVSIVIIIIIFIVGVLLGAALLSGYIRYIEETSTPDKISTPDWKPGKYWTYSFKTPEIEDVISRIVVASEDGADYLVGVGSRIDAQRHGVLNFNPMLGRITIESLSVYEKGIPQPLFSFPLRKSSQWTFSMFGVEGFNAHVMTIKSADIPDNGETYLANIQATAPNGEKLTYSYDTKAQWIRSLVLEDPSGNALLEMNLVSYGFGHSGEVYFVRGVDLFDEKYISPLIDIYNTFIDQGHPDWGPFDFLIYYYDIVTEDASGGTLTVTDPASEAAMRRFFGPGMLERTLGTIPSESGEWGVTVSLAGNSHLALKIAGGIEYIWTM